MFSLMFHLFKEHGILDNIVFWVSEKQPLIVAFGGGGRRK
jgi:hypothetical protein